MCYSCPEEEDNERGKGKMEEIKIEHKMLTVFSALMWFERVQGWR